MDWRSIVQKAFSTAFPQTLPIFAGFTFLGVAYGLYMRSAGFDAFYPIIMSFTIFAGSMEFVAVGFLLGPFDPFRALIVTLMVNARHLFYGLSMLDKYGGTGWKKPYLIFGMCDESFAINLTADIPQDVDRGWFMFFVTLLNHSYWVFGATLGGLAGSFVSFDAKGLEFVMTALFIVIFLEQWRKEKTHYSAVIGLGVSLLCLVVIGGENFIIPAMALIMGILALLRKPLAVAEAKK